MQSQRPSSPVFHWLRHQLKPRSTDPKDARREYFLLASLALLCMVTLLSLVMFTVLWLTDRSTGGLIGRRIGVAGVGVHVYWRKVYCARERGVGQNSAINVQPARNRFCTKLFVFLAIVIGAGRGGGTDPAPTHLG